ncbi:uncharacterized protein B0I36DRAFT_434317 [Microdochium trichocladiopsis]|uniref:Zn(2)-C6 fungal-type domain-containing protein n=1 Tax=Microdochium trichocladiopsis TaxID=1682393 RepID=A0A9P9BL91_9PEZI|nr:uncharacterized protein B0I36DRAFT_434317 [Microdochium trichocladiopsis]KAH7024654.1 hypothetical protein B0I36DRAFT_434317 [Microdochium trichocladiopsis]
MARGHTKSRFGCRECKQRHIKCDESKPGCVNCITVKRQCSFLSLSSATSLPAQQWTSPTPIHACSPPSSSRTSRQHEQPRVPGSTSHRNEAPSQTPSSAYDTPISSSSHASADETLPDDYFTLTHLRLLHHYQTELSDLLIAQQPQAAPMLRYMVSSAMGAPFLMDQVLSMAAAHKCTTTCLDSLMASTERPVSASQPDYFVEASMLQSRSMRKFHVAREALGGDAFFHRQPLEILSFSVLVSHSALFFACAAATRYYFYNSDAAPGTRDSTAASSTSQRNNNITFGVVLDEFDTCYMVHSGMADVARQVIPLVDADVRNEMFSFAGRSILVDKENPKASTPRQTDLDKQGYASPSTTPSSSSSMDVDTRANDAIPPLDLLESLVAIASTPSSASSSASLFAGFSAYANQSQDPRHLLTYRTTLDVLLKEYRDAATDDGSRPRSQRYLSATQHFLVRSPPQYRELLAQRRPEALVIFAYYAVLMHRAGDYWGIGSLAGGVLVTGIEGYLGGFWRRWLEWPVAQVGRQ